jgi:CheY-like chemotaxis protein
MTKFRPDSIRILVVDDEPSILMLYQETFRSEADSNNFDLTLCSQAEEAVEAVRRAVEPGT